MDLFEQNPRPKKFCRLKQNLALPVILKKDNTIHKFTGKFNGFYVEITVEEDMKKVISMGYFGKASFSRSYPQFTSNILRKRQFENRKNLCGDLQYKGRPDKVVVVPDSDSENEEYFVNLQPKYEIDTSSIKETVCLCLEEAFFLAQAVECLNIFENDKLLDVEQLWAVFSKTEPKFPTNYVVYFYYRSKNWVVKPGVKFGGNYLLYKQGPPFFHASYVVLIEVLKEHGKEKDDTKDIIDNKSLFGLNRLCETAGKELLICKILCDNSEEIHYNNLAKIEIKEIVIKRWISSKERDTDD